MKVSLESSLRTTTRGKGGQGKIVYVESNLVMTISGKILETV
jgi:hypothetical protein